MKRSQRWALSTVLILGMISASSVDADAFDDARLRAGLDAYGGKRYGEAIDQFRIAAFGSLDSPPRLSTCLVWLTLAEAAGGRSGDVKATLSRFLEVERRFGAYPKAALEADTRAAFQTILLREVPAPTILSVPTLANLIETEEQKIAKLPPSERRKALEAAARRDPNQASWPVAIARDALDAGKYKEADTWATRALTLEPSSTAALAVRAHARTLLKDYAGALLDLDALSAADLAQRPELLADRFVCLVARGDWVGAESAWKSVPRGDAERADVAAARRQWESRNARASASAGPAEKGAGPPGGSTGPPPADPAVSRAALAEARRLISTQKAADAERLLTEALRQDPQNRELRLALLEAACLTQSYPIAAAQIPLVAPFSDADSVPMFYAAVVLWETGHGTEARTYLERAIPKVSGPLVDEYAKKILGHP